MRAKLLKKSKGLQIGQEYEIAALVLPNTLTGKGVYLNVLTSEFGHSQSFEYRNATAFNSNWQIIQGVGVGLEDNSKEKK